MCSIYPLPGEGIFTTRTLVSIYSVDDLASPVLQNEYEGSCPVTETVLSAVAQEARPAELRLDWRTGAPR